MKDIHSLNISFLNDTRLIDNVGGENGPPLPHHDCLAKRNSSYEYFLNVVWFWIDMLVYFVIPLCTMSLSFVFIMSKINSSNKSYTNFLFNRDYKANSRIYKKKIKKNKQIVSTLFFINLYFFVSTMPYFVFNILVQTHGSYLLEAFVNILFYSNNALSLFFYGITSNKFRNELMYWLRSLLFWRKT